MTVQEIVLDLLSYANIYGFELGGSTTGEDEGEVVKAVAAVDHAVQTIYADGPQSLKYSARASYINAPTPITWTTTTGSKLVTVPGQFAPWMRGCSTLIAGEQLLNRIVDIVYDSVGDLSTYSLLRTITGAGGNQLATVYGDCYLLDPDVSAVLEPVTLASNWRLRPAQSKIDFLRTYYWSCPISGRRCCYYPFYTVWEKVIGIPQDYRVEQRMDTANIGGSLYLSVNPMPLMAGNINYDVHLKPVPIDRETDLAEDGGDDPGATIKSLPADMVESYLLPIARWKYVAAHPNIQNRETRGALKDEYEESTMRLKNGESLTPQLNAVRARYI
jgi:hypothetical protein